MAGGQRRGHVTVESEVTRAKPVSVMEAGSPSAWGATAGQWDTGVLRAAMFPLTCCVRVLCTCAQML